MDNIISKQDMETLEKIADKYSISIQELGKIISQKERKNYLTLQIRFSDEELNILNERSRKLNIARSKYCVLCYQKAMKEHLYKDLNVLEIIGKERQQSKKTNRINISFSSNENDYKEMKKLAEELGIKFTSLIRYFALNINL